MKIISKEIAFKNLKSTFLSLGKDQELIWRKLFVDNPYKDTLKRLLIINNEDCLDVSNEVYKEEIKVNDLKQLLDNKYLRTTPRLDFGEHEQIKSYILLEFDDFVPSENPEFRNCVISITVMCHLDCWDMEDYGLRPYLIAGCIDGILNHTKLSGIGTLEFMGASQIVLSENLGGVLLRYIATHGSEDQEPTEELMQ